MYLNLHTVVHNIFTTIDIASDLHGNKMYVGGMNVGGA